MKKDIQNLICPECGNKHSSESKYCNVCGKNLESLILEFKKKRLPVQYERRIMSKAEYVKYHKKGEPLPLKQEKMTDSSDVDWEEADRMCIYQI